MSSLSVGIHAEFQMGNLLGGRIDWPLGCNLAVSQGYYLIQADLVRGGGDGMDVAALLNSSFGCSLPDGNIILMKLVFLRLGAFKKHRKKTR
ncbi:MAG: hypothetical protein PHN64_08485 [Desulfovibrionaceae bacterium]|nr:hypothetical protein [Desulfovibrionaceae bacterium]